jgi:pleiotropic regulator 1
MLLCFALIDQVWDMRTKAQIHCLSGHTNTVAQVRCQAAEPQVSLLTVVCQYRLLHTVVDQAKQISTESTLKETRICYH